VLVELGLGYLLRRGVSKQCIVNRIDCEAAQSCPEVAAC
jgi:hypothetical protein